MKIKITPLNNFLREAKPLVKKYNSLKKEIKILTDELEINPRQGIKIKENTYKIRLAVKSKGKGKSGGMRIITFVHEVVEDNDGELFVYLLSIYDKSNQENISDNLLMALIEDATIEKSDEKNSLTDNDLNENK